MTVASMCIGVFGFEDDYVLHSAAGIGALVDRIEREDDSGRGGDEDR